MPGTPDIWTWFGLGWVREQDVVGRVGFVICLVGLGAEKLAYVHVWTI